MAKAKPVEKEPEAEERSSKLTAGADEEGDAAPEGSAEEQGGKQKSKKKIVIIGAAAGAVLLLALGGAYYMGFFRHEDKAAVELGPDGKPIEKAIYYTLPEFLINLNSGSKQSSFLKATVILEVAHQGDISQIEANLPRLLDALNTYLRELRPSDLAGSAGIQRLREELLLRGNKILAPVKINDVLFKEIIVQ